MTATMKHGLPPIKTYSVKEFGGETGEIIDPLVGDRDYYLKCANELSKAIDKVVDRL
jgi:hypothetical protein